MTQTRPVAVYYSVLKYQPENRRRLDDCFKVIELPDPSYDTEVVLRQADVLFAPLGFRVDASKMDRAPRLKVIASNTTGHPHIDVEAAINRRIAVACLKSERDFLQTITPTAELTFGLIVALTRNILPAHKAALAGRWDRRPFGAPAMLSRMSLGVVGLGRLGHRVASYGQVFGMQVRYFDPYVESSAFSREVELQALVAKSDIVSIHVPHEPATERMFDEAVFSSFRHGSWLVNTARGELLDWDALLAALESGRLAGAALDVFENEFNPDFSQNYLVHPLLAYARAHDNLILTPHIGGSTIDAWRLTEAHTIDMILAALERNPAGAVS